MLKRSPLILLLLAVGAVFIAGVVQLFHLRFDRGDIYPPYSSLRADPLGTKALYDSLDQLNETGVERNVRPLERGITAPARSTLLHLGSNVERAVPMTAATAEALESYMKAGGRLVLSFRPVNLSPLEERLAAAQTRRFGPPDASRRRSDRGNEPGHPKDEATDIEERHEAVSLAGRWHFRMAYQPLERNPDGEYESVTAVRGAADDERLPPSIFWHTALYFEGVGDDWRVIYRWEDRPVMIERPFGDGSMVVSADSYFLSNEALRSRREPALLAWIIGPAGHVIFDETHLGIAYEPGVAALLRRYRLHGVIAAFLVLAALFVWKNATPFVPPHPATTGTADVVQGRDSAAGFINLLRRGISRKDLLSVCVAEWNKGCAHGRPALAPKLKRVEEFVEAENRKPARERDPVAAYGELTRIVSERAVHRTPESRR